MNLYKIWTVHIRMWSPREIRVFAILFALVVLFLCRLVKRHKMNCRQAVAGGILFLFLGLVYASTVFTRGIINWYHSGHGGTFSELEILDCFRKIF